MICVLQSCNQLAYHTHTSLLLSNFQQIHVYIHVYVLVYTCTYVAQIHSIFDIKHFVHVVYRALYSADVSFTFK